MAINYTLLFTRMGKFVKVINLFVQNQGDLLLEDDVGADDILDEFNDNRDLVKGLRARFESWALVMSSWGKTLRGFNDNVLRDLQEELNSPTSATSQILKLLIEDMEGSQSVLENIISTPGVVAGGANVGDGELVVDINNVDGDPDERIIVETVDLKCKSDRFSGAAAGSERFRVTGFPKPSLYTVDDLGVAKRGNGTGGQKALTNSKNKIVNGNFDGWSGTPNAASGWDAVQGVFGTDINEETTNIFIPGGSSLEFLGAASPANIEIKKDLVTVLKANTRYVGAIWLRKSVGLVGGSSTYSVELVGTGMSARTIFSANPSTLTTSFVKKSIFFTTPSDMPSNMRIRILWTGSSGHVGEFVWADELVVAEPFDFGHVKYGLFRGPIDFILDDLFTVTTSNTYAGNFQTWFGWTYDVMLPSAAAPTIADGLAA